MKNNTSYFYILLSGILMNVLCVEYSLGQSVRYVDDDNVSNTHNGSSTYPYSDIQSAISKASNNDTIKVAVGSYSYINNNNKSLVILGGYTGATNTSYNTGSGGDFNTCSSDPSLTIISGNASNIGLTLTRNTDDAFKLLFSNFTVRNGRKGIVFDTETSWPHVENVTISDCIVENNGSNNADTEGGGIIVAGKNNKLLNNTIRNNQGGRGAGISISSSEIINLLIEGNLIENNTSYADHCGGIYLDGTATLNKNIISGNRLENSYGWGGGVLILGTAHMSNNIIKDNYCDSYGGAVFVDDGATLYMENELIYNNHTNENGAAIAVDHAAGISSHAYIKNCTIANNSSPGSDGGNAVYMDLSSFATVTNCITYGNGDDFYVRESSSLTVNYTLSQESIVGEGNITGNPSFVNINDNNFHLAANSQCIDKGSNDDVTAGFDFDGSTRIQDGDGNLNPVVDMGAYEFGSGPVHPAIIRTINNHRCGPGVVTLEAIANVGTINWYATSTNTHILSTGASYTTPSISNTTDYYVEAISEGDKSDRIKVTATIHSIPSITDTNNVSRCGAGTVTLGATSSIGSTINWYTQQTGGTLVQTGTDYTISNLTSTTTYYVEATDGECVSTQRVEVVAVINNGCVTDFKDLNSESSIILYPNPTSGSLTIEFTGNSKEIIIEVYDNMGSLTKTLKKNQGENTVQLELSDFYDGLYIIKISSPDMTSIRKIIKRG